MLKNISLKHVTYSPNGASIGWIYRTFSLAKSHRHHFQVRRPVCTCAAFSGVQKIKIKSKDGSLSNWRRWQLIISENESQTYMPDHCKFYLTLFLSLTRTEIVKFCEVRRDFTQAKLENSSLYFHVFQEREPLASSKSSHMDSKGTIRTLPFSTALGFPTKIESFSHEYMSIFHKIHGTGIFSYIYHRIKTNVGKYPTYGSYIGIGIGSSCDVFTIHRESTTKKEKRFGPSLKPRHPHPSGIPLHILLGRNFFGAMEGTSAGHTFGQSD